LKIDTFDGFAHTSDTVSFTLTNTSGGTWANANAVLTANSNGSLAGAHVFVTTLPANLANGASATGYASDGNDVPATPDPASAVLLGIGGISLLGFARWRRPRQPVSA
jgi:hypothetical protein